MRVERRSAYEIGCRDEFDIVFSMGVIHHLAHPERALANMVTAAKPGGRLLIFGFRHLRSIVFDQMLAKIAHYWPRATVKHMMREQGLREVRLI